MKRLNTHFDPNSKVRGEMDPRRFIFRPEINHSVYVPPDDGEPTTFEWHFQRGMLSPRMSAFELCEFVLNHMRAIIDMGLMRDHPKVEGEFRALFMRLALSPREVIDRLLPWIKVKYREGEDDVISMNMFEKSPQPEGKVYFA